MMLFSRKRERGSLMVEAIAVIALLGLMGTILYRQVKQRNDELDNINMASEIRVVKEATMAYIQSNKSMLEANSGINPGGCAAGNDDDCYGYYDNPSLLADIDGYMPDNWGGDGSIINSYRIGVICYVVVPGENRTACYGMIVPNSPNDPNGSPMPAGFTLRRAARVANLIGADGGVHPGGGDTTLNGTQGTWLLDCKDIDVCDGRDDPFYVATTGVDVYIPEVDAPDNMALIPDSLALTRLHSTDYFSVGNGDQNCVTNYDSAGGHYQHENVEGGMVVDDTIANVGTGGCDPLFWVGTAGGGSDSSEPGQVYVKNSLFVGRDNATGTHAVGIETGTGGADRKLEVYSADGNARLTLNAEGQVIGHNESGRGYKLDARTGSIVLFQTVDGIDVQTLRLSGNRLESTTYGLYREGHNTTVPENRHREPYHLQPDGVSFVNDIRLAARGGAKLSEVLPKYSLMEVKPITNEARFANAIAAPTCPYGYEQAITVTPTLYSSGEVTDVQYRIAKDAALLNGTGNVAANNNTIPSFTHASSHEKGGDGAGNPVWQHRPNVGAGDDGTVDSSIEVNQIGRVQVSILRSVPSLRWWIELTYVGDAGNVFRDGGMINGARVDAHPINALVHTYCVFNEANFQGGNSRYTGLHDEHVSEGYYVEGTWIGDVSIPSPVGAITSTCSVDADCLNTEECSAGACVSMGPCTADSGNKRCLTVNGQQIFVFSECENDASCGDGRVCYNNRCKEP